MTQVERDSKKDQPKYGFWPLIIPFLTFMVVGMFESSFGDRPQSESEHAADVSPTQADSPQTEDPKKDVRHKDDDVNSAQVLPPHDYEVRLFLVTYFVKILITSVLLAYFWRYYLDQFPFSVSFLSVIVGVIGVVLWVGLSDLGIEKTVLGWAGMEQLGQRSEFNPFTLLAETWQRSGFFALRFFGLVIVVPICEELFLRGFLMRYFESPHWWTIRLSELGTKALLIAPIYGGLTHPAEFLAAIVWFSLVTWMMKRNGKFWDCVLAHAVTNLLLGLYVVAFGQWQYW